MDGTKHAAIFEEDCYCNSSELHTVDIHTDVSMKEYFFKELFQKSDNN